MEDCAVHNETKKRSGDELVSESCSPELKRSRVDSGDLNKDETVAEDSESGRVDSSTDLSESGPVHSSIDPSESGRVDPLSYPPDRVDSADDLYNRVESVVPEPESPDTIQLTDEILDILEDADIDSSIQGLDSVIKSFEEEITIPTETPFPATDSGEFDYLLGASDDELGLPPAKSPSDHTPENKPTESATSPDHNFELKQDFSFVDELPAYDSAEFGLGEDNYDRNEFITLGNGLFDYSEAPDYLWHPESLTAL
ncbi:hypothetical protein DCAR_0312841 [Daucus carota subsp. sativus]|uniref:Uncharacterized protein n=1 Tax=Daucus carota subsp. sativus TaxID=79200 RepID=A0A166BB85_DAUCS|nr:PREDICTED: uncharacterized protein LOC108211087 [Daucus carota subsp. sativus]WOG93555.1 hypothetical protein DCAR_0312841 [Daucus carota subsp. sativus]